MKAGEIKSGKLRLLVNLVDRLCTQYCIYNNYKSDLIVIM